LYSRVGADVIGIKYKKINDIWLYKITMVAARHSVHIADIRLWVTLGMKWDPGALDP
jgi:hypothetical protein